MSRPLGLSQADYEELEKPRPRGEASLPFRPPSLTWWEQVLWLLLCAACLVLTSFLYVGAQLCKIGTRR